MLVRLPNSSAVQVGGSPSRRFCRLGFPRDHRLRAEHGVDPGDQLEPPVAGVQAHHARAQREESDGQFQERAGEGGIVDVGRREKEEQR